MRPARKRRMYLAALSCSLLSGCSGFAVIAVLDAGMDGGAPMVDASAMQPELEASTPPDAAASCGRTLEIENCNPITNSGCSREIGMQCDVDLLASTLRGQCVFSAPPTDAGTCLNIPPTETCPPRHTCVDFNECRKVCLCDTDCDPGDCCNVLLANQGFKTCKPCDALGQ
jgi:hypothetical protein